MNNVNEVTNPSEWNERVERMVMPEEAHRLVVFHTNEGDYARDCSANQKAIANKEPLYTFADKQTKEDWLEAAADWETRRKHHRARARFWREYLEA